MPPAELELGADEVRGLLRAQAPDYAELALIRVANGWDNVMYRLGAELCVRVPRRAAAAGLIEREQRWLPVLAPNLPLHVPVPVVSGRPQDRMPWAWSVAPWFDGQAAAEVDAEAAGRGAKAGALDGGDTARRLGGFVAALHRPAPGGAPANPFRGVDLITRDVAVGERLERLAPALAGMGLDRAALERGWSRARGAARYSGPPLWLHGDLHPANLIVRHGRLTAVIDFGDLCAGDPATDLAVAWMLLPAAHRREFRHAAGAHRPIDDATWIRAWGWALQLGLAILAGSADHPVMAGVARRTLAAVLADPPEGGAASEDASVGWR